jgi:signal transduction histidine kinase
MDASTLKLALQAGQKSPTSDGDGLGLAIVGELADRYGVDLTVDSSPGQGTRTVLTLPAD